MGAPLDAESAERPRLHPILAPLVACLFVAALQLPVARLGDDWIFFSHFGHMPWLAAAPAESAVTTNTSVADGRRFRPIAYTHMWLEQKLGLGFPVSFAIGIAYLAAAAGMLALLLLRLGAPPPVASATALLFVLHPAQAEAWGWATARIDTMAAAFGLAGLWLTLRGRPWLAGLAFFAAYGSKESAYPLLFCAPLLAWAGRTGRRGALRASLAAGLPLVLLLLAKWLVVGEVFAASWQRGIDDVGLGTRLAGYTTVLRPLLLQPVSTASPAPAATGWALGVLLVATPIVGFATRRPRPRFGPTFALLVCFGLAVAVTFGVPVHADLGGGRVWLVPSALLLGALMRYAAPRLLLAVVVVSGVLLHFNLTPYREAAVLMRRAEATVAYQLRNPRVAVRGHDLPARFGPVPLFFLMTELYHDTLSTKPGQVPRVLLTRPEHSELDDSGWRKAMAHRGLTVVDLHWDEERRVLRP